MPVIDKIIGHRGASAYAPENTIASFDKALSLGCKFIEFDVIFGPSRWVTTMRNVTSPPAIKTCNATGKNEPALLTSGLICNKWIIGF